MSYAPISYSGGCQADRLFRKNTTRYRSGLEIELYLTKNSIKLLIPGMSKKPKLDGMLSHLEHVFPFLQDLPFRGKHWDELTFKEKKTFFAHAISSGDVDHDHRIIPNIQLREKIPLYFSKRERLFGIEYGPGVVQFPLRKTFDPEVEGLSQFRMVSSDGFEIHVRGNVAATSLSHDVLSLMQKLFIFDVDRHAHLISSFPGLSNPKVDFAETFSDFISRADLFLAALLRPTQYEFLLAPQCWLSAVRDIYIILQYPENGSRFVMGPDKRSVGLLSLVGSGRYSSTKLWGLHAGFLDSELPRDIENILIGRFQEIFTTLDYGEYGLQFRDWKAAKPRDFLSSIQKRYVIAPKNDFHMRRFSLEKVDAMALLFKFFLADWSDDPLFFEIKGAQNRAKGQLLSAQQNAVRALKEEAIDSESILFTLMIDSGLMQRLAWSLGFASYETARLFEYLKERSDAIKFQK